MVYYFVDVLSRGDTPKDYAVNGTERKQVRAWLRARGMRHEQPSIAACTSAMKEAQAAFPDVPMRVTEGGAL